MEKLQQSYEYPESKYASDLMHVEILLEKKELNECFERYTELLQNNLLTSPDVWVLGSVLLLLLDQEDDARDYLIKSRSVNDLSFVSPTPIEFVQRIGGSQQCIDWSTDIWCWKSLTALLVPFWRENR